MFLYEFLIQHFLPMFIDVDSILFNIDNFNLTFLNLFNMIYGFFVSLVISLVFVYLPYKVFKKVVKGGKK